MRVLEIERKAPPPAEPEERGPGRPRLSEGEDAIGRSITLPAVMFDMLGELGRRATGKTNRSAGVRDLLRMYLEQHPDEFPEVRAELDR